MSMDHWFPEPESRPITVGEAWVGARLNYIEHPGLKGKQKEIAKLIPVYGDGGDVTGGSWFGHKKLSMDKPSRTINKEAWQFYHPERSDCLSIGELARIQTFPDGYIFLGSWREASPRIGNSVPPLFMRSIARNIKSMLQTGKPIRSDGKLKKIMDYPALLEEAYQQMIAPRKEGAPTVISTFAGGGGSSAGYHMAGFNELLAVEWDDNAVQTLRLNFPHLDIYHGDIAKLSVEEVLQRTGLRPGELDVFDGSPPCQGFSSAGKRDFNDDRNQLFREYVRLLRGLQPKVFVMENVSGMVKGKMKLIFAEILKELKGSGYRVSARLLNAMYFNVPQSRERMIFIGIREDIGIEPSHPKAESQPIAAKEATRGVSSKTLNRPLATVATAIWNHVKPGQNGTHYRAGYYMNSLKVHPDRPMPTIPKIIPGGGGHMHWMEQRSLSIEEAKRGASFPDEYKFVGRFDAQWERIGNSVPPLFMKSIAVHIRDALLFTP